VETLELLSLLILAAANVGGLCYLLSRRQPSGPPGPPPPWLKPVGRPPCPAGCCWLALAPAGGPSLPPTSIWRRREPVDGEGG
jgi:hypothetical protein